MSHHEQFTPNTDFLGFKEQMRKGVAHDVQYERMIGYIPHRALVYHARPHELKAHKKRLLRYRSSPFCNQGMITEDCL